MRQLGKKIIDKKVLRDGLLLVVIMLLACKFTSSIAYAAFYPILILSFVSRKPERALLVLLMMTAFLCVNAYFVPKSTIYSYLQRGGVILTGGIMVMSMLSRGVSKFIHPLFGVIIFVLYMIIPSIYGWSMIVSLLKIVLFVMTISAWFGLGNMIIKEIRGDTSKIRSAVLCYAIFMMIGSFILIPFPAISQMGLADMTAAEIADRMSVISLFKGMAQHSQALGPVVAISLVLVLGDYVFGVRRNNWLYNVIIFCGIVCLYKTSSRTAMGTALVGFGVVVASLVGSKMANTRWKSKVRNAFLVAGFVSLVAVVAIPSARDAALRFVVKYNTQDSRVIKRMTMNDVTSSRRGAFDRPLANWRKKPAIGNGFQVSEDMSWVKTNDIKQLTSAPVEKGTWIVAVLEEGGVFGMVILVLWIICALVTLGRNQCHVGRAVLVALLVANLGEFSMFSLSYIGSVEWVLVVTGIILDYVRFYDSRHSFYGQPDVRALADQRFGNQHRQAYPPSYPSRFYS